MSPSELERIAILAEECAEVAQIAMKIVRHGYECHHPIGEWSNRTELQKELGDLRWIINKMMLQGDIVNEKIESFREQKEKRVGKWLHYNTP